MFPLPLTPEQKLDAIYVMLKREQSARRWGLFFRVIKWTIILGGFYVLFTNPTLMMNSLMERVQPLITEQVQSILDGQKNALMEKIKDISPSQPILIDGIPQ